VAHDPGNGQTGAQMLVSPASVSASLDGAGVPAPSPLLERPEVAVGIAFLGGLLLAALVRRLGR
jgi:hypothetical protein